MVFLASGTGFAPIKALLEHMQHKGMTRPVSLYWVAAALKTCTWMSGSRS